MIKKNNDNDQERHVKNDDNGNKTPRKPQCLKTYKLNSSKAIQY
jgi:hypothetical protein